MLKFLLVGKDFHLLATRAAILSRTGASTVCCNPAEMKRDLAGDKFDVVILCHSLVPQDADEGVAGLAQQWWPQAKILLLRPNFSGAKYEEIQCDAVIPADPAGMLRETMVLLRGLPDLGVEELQPPTVVSGG